ncbi:hypothetical protein [Neisseria zalophi]|uniref:hypothetical protein n=1 Tax=Neisseria zalophi TaxID=640030 RepID=UPI0012467581|nr:hypothetical protein [Neisseria zalophi]
MPALHQPASTAPARLYYVAAGRTHQPLKAWQPDTLSVDGTSYQLYKHSIPKAARTPFQTAKLSDELLNHVANR